MLHLRSHDVEGATTIMHSCFEWREATMNLDLYAGSELLIKETVIYNAESSFAIAPDKHSPGGFFAQKSLSIIMLHQRNPDVGCATTFPHSCFEWRDAIMNSNLNARSEWLIKEAASMIV